jgi:hypothetical protein
MLGNWNLSLNDLNSQRAYPLSETATLTDLSGQFRIPDSFLLGIYLPMHGGQALNSLLIFVRSISIFPVGYAITLAYDDGTFNPPVVASVSFARSSHSPGMSYVLIGTGDFDDVVGKIVIGSLDDIDAGPAGQFLFDRSGGLLDSDCLRTTALGVDSITVIDGLRRSEKLRGDIRLISGTNFQITTGVVDGVTTIRFDAISGAGLTETCDCEGQGPLPPPIRTIDGVGADSYGNFNLVGSACVQTIAMTNGIELVDSCSQPCCTNTELQEVIRELMHLGSEAVTVSDAVRRLVASEEQFANLILGSKLGDGGCISC